MELATRLGVLGLGSMGSALLRGVLARGRVAPEDVVASSLDADGLARLARGLGVRAAATNAHLVAASDVVLLAVKPAQVPAVLDELRDAWQPGQLLVSVAAGIPLAVLAAHLPSGMPVVRAMPNTPCLVGEGVTGFCLGPHAGEPHAELATMLFGAVGLVERVPEASMDAVTAVSGSGPAYLFAFLEALYSAAEALGLEEGIARRLVDQTVMGAARLVRDSGEHPTTLRRRVTSPGGTTAAALEILAERDLAGTLRAALAAARDRGAALGAAAASSAGNPPP